MNDDAPITRQPLIKTGSLLVIGFGVFLLLGWFLYRPYIPQVWLHDLAADISYRAAVDPNAPPPEDMREATPRQEANSPYICVSKIVRVPWDRFVVVTRDQDPRTNPALASAAWAGGSVAEMADQLTRDERYQYIVLLNEGMVADAQLFFTFWGDLSALARPQGFTREEAVFTSASENGVYVLTPAANPPAGACS
jgi:hypothetical protein